MSTKVIVIDDSPCKDGTPVPFKFGDTVHISELTDMQKIRLYFCTGNNPDNYCIVDEFYTACSCGDPNCFTPYFKKRFAPVSNIDENEMERILIKTENII